MHVELRASHDPATPLYPCIFLCLCIPYLESPFVSTISINIPCPIPPHGRLLSPLIGLFCLSFIRDVLSLHPQTLEEMQGGQYASTPWYMLR